MPKVPLTQAAYVGRSVIAEAQRCINLYGEKNPEDAQFPYTYYQTPGLTQVGSFLSGSTVTLGSPEVAPMRGAYFWQGLLYVVLGPNLYSVNSSFQFVLIGAVGGGNQPVGMAASNNSLIVVVGNTGFVYGLTQLLTAILVSIPTAGATQIMVYAGFIQNGDTLKIVLDNGNVETVTVTGGGGTNNLTISPALSSTAAQFNVVTDTSRNFGQITDPGFTGGLSIYQVDGFFVIPALNSNQFNISLFELPIFDALDFAAKITYEDNISNLIVMHGEIWLLGSLKSTEIWYNTGAANFAFGILPGTIVEHGCVAPFSAAKIDLSIFWLGIDQQGTAVVFQGNAYQAKRVSTHAIEFAIQQYSMVTDAIGMVYQLNGHFFYVITFPTGDATWVYDLTTGLWHQWAFMDQNGLLHRHRANFLVEAYGQTLVGDFQNGALYVLSEFVYQDFGNPIARIRGWQHIVQDNKRVSYSQFVADLEVGEVPPPPTSAIPPPQPNPVPPPTMQVQALPQPPPVPTFPPLVVFNAWGSLINMTTGLFEPQVLAPGWESVFVAINPSFNDFATNGQFHLSIQVAQMPTTALIEGEFITVYEHSSGSNDNALTIDALTPAPWVFSDVVAGTNSYPGIFGLPQPINYPGGTLPQSAGSNSLAPPYSVFVPGVPNSVMVIVVTTVPGDAINSVIEEITQLMDDPVFLPFQERGSGNDELSPDIILKVFWAPNPLGAPINAVFVANATIMSEITIVAFSLTGGDINNPWNTNAVFPEYASEEDDIAFGSSVPLTTNATGESSITLSALPNPSFAGNPVSLTAFVESEGTPIGFVTFVDGTEVIATGVVESEAGVTVIINDFSQGFHNLIANFAGSSVSAPSTSPLVVLEVENGL